MSLTEALLTACFRKSFKVIKANINKNGQRFFKSIQDLNEKLKVKIILFLNMHKNRSHITAIQKRAQMKSLTSIFVAKKVYSPGDHVFPRVNLQLSNYLQVTRNVQDIFYFILCFLHSRPATQNWETRTKSKFRASHKRLMLFQFQWYVH